MLLYMNTLLEAFNEDSSYYTDFALLQRGSGEYDNTRTGSPSLEPTETTPLNPTYTSLPTQEEVCKHIGCS